MLRHNKASGIRIGTAEVHAGGQSGEVSAQQIDRPGEARVSGRGPHREGDLGDEERSHLPVYVLSRIRKYL